MQDFYHQLYNYTCTTPEVFRNPLGAPEVRSEKGEVLGAPLKGLAILPVYAFRAVRFVQGIGALQML